MATSLSSNTFSSVYRDDYQDSDNYHRILFNGGKALQARELTQSQTIINKELERLGTNLFINGGAVTGGSITVDNKVEYVLHKGNPNINTVTVEKNPLGPFQKLNGYVVVDLLENVID